MIAAIEFTHLLAVLQLATTVVVAVIGYLYKRTVALQDERIEATEQQGRETSKRVEELKDSVRDDTVDKEEWLRESGISRQRQEKILEKLSILEGKNQAGVEIGAAIAAALNRVAKD